MKLFKIIISFIFIFNCANCLVFAQKIDEFKAVYSSEIKENIVHTGFQFNGYTNYWHNIYREWIRYGNLYKIAIPNVEYTIIQNKVDIAEDLGISGLLMQEGFLTGLLSETYITLDQPSVQQLEESLKKGNVLAIVDPDSETGKKLATRPFKDNLDIKKLKSHQYDSKDFIEVDAIIFENNNRRLFVISSTNISSRNLLKSLIDNTKKLIQEYDLHKGWFGAKTLMNSVTCTAGHYLDVIGKGMNEGNNWFVFDGYMDFLSQKDLDSWIAKGKIPVVADVGTTPIYGCINYDTIQLQANYPRETWIKYAHEKDGYVFRQVFDTAAINLPYDGYMTNNDGNKEQIDNDNFPFVCSTGSLDEDVLTSMVLFIKKSEAISKKLMWDAIMDCRAVAALDNGKMMGPAMYRNALQLLFLDRVFLEEYFGDRIGFEASIEGYELSITLTNTYQHNISGELEVVLPVELKMAGSNTTQVNLPANSSKTLHFTLQPDMSAMDKVNPITMNYKWGNNKKSAVAKLDLPRVISIHKLLYGHAPKVTYPVTVHNFSNESSFPVKVEVFNKNNTKKAIYSDSKLCTTKTAAFQDMSFDLKLPAGSYDVKVTALGVENTTQLGVGKAAGAPTITEVDVNNDGVKEYVMENENVRVMLLATGARVIEYFIKSRNDNVLFKLWPEKPIDDRRPYRKRGYYPYGGFEDFLGQGSMETHKVYDAEILKSSGDYVQVRMTADYYGNKLEKIFTLFGDSPLLEVRFALTYKNEEANVIGPQPILELGEKHWTEDVFTTPEIDGLKEYRMIPHDYYGRLIYLKEGWNAGYDTNEDVSFVGAFPVTEPLFLHMWMNHPRNSDAHHYYVEFQPWTPIYQKSTMYFSYYLWGTGGAWQDGVKALRDRNLITEIPNK